MRFHFEAPRLPAAAGPLRREVRAFILETERAAGRLRPRSNSWLAYDEAFTPRCGEAGYIGMTFPREYGGHGRSALERYVVCEEMLAAGAPLAMHWIADRQSGPQILRHGSEAARRRVIPEIGHFALVLAFLLAVALCVLPLVGAQRRDAVLMGSAPVLALGVLTFVEIAFGCLVYAFVNDDFSVAYVANNSNTRLPLQFKVSALWGAHEGSFLLWCFWGALIVLFVWRSAKELEAPVMMVYVSTFLGVIAILCKQSAVQAAASPAPRRRRGPEPAPAGPVDGHPPASDVHRVRLALRALRLRDRSAQLSGSPRSIWTIHG